MKKEIGRLKNTLVHDFYDDFQKFQMVKELLIEDIEQLDPVIIRDIASISVEEMVFGVLFQSIFKKCKEQCKQEDALIVARSKLLLEEDLYEELEIPEKFRDPCEY